MASLTIFTTPALVNTGRVYGATAAKGGSEEKSIMDWILGGMQKQDQLLETDPILKKVEEKNGDGRSKTTTVVVPPKKKDGNGGGVFGGLGGLFAKK